MKTEKYYLAILLLTKIRLVYDIWYKNIWPTCIIILKCIFHIWIFIKHDITLKLSTEFPSTDFIFWRPSCNSVS